VNAPHPRNAIGIAGSSPSTAVQRVVLIRSEPLERELETGRLIGDLGPRGGATVVVTAGLHGNEPSGVFAVHEVLDKIRTSAVPLKGRVVGLAGNLAALARNVRQIDRDLNRVWTGPEMARLLDDPVTARRDSAEAVEALELHAAIRELLASGPGPYYFIDLHTTSSVSSPFIPFDDTLKNRDFVRHFPVAGVLGIEEYLPGTLLSYLTRFNVVTLGYEAGQHVAPESVSSHAALLWLALDRAGCLGENHGIDVSAQKELLVSRANELSGFFEVRFRYGIGPEEQFRMKPGFRNFAPVQKNSHLADNQHGPIRAQLAGRILMPLYQSAGSDGYFLVRQIAPFWLSLSRHLRRGHYERWLALLPGVRIAPDDPESLEVDTRVARFLATQIFHLLGYRRHRAEGRIIRWSRREI
jgi:predicted deacylase